MRGRAWIRDILSHFVILLLLGGGLFFLYKKARDIPFLAQTPYFKPVFITAFSLLGLMILIFFFQVFSSARLERFSPGNSGSLARLDRIRRFRLPRRYQDLHRTWPDFRSDLMKELKRKGWTGGEVKPFEAILAKKRRLPRFGRPPLVDRLFVFYHPMMNVIIVDQILKETERLIEGDYPSLPAPRSCILFLTDMKNRDEVTSAGAGVVNYLCTPLERAGLYPVLIDLAAGRFFYPLDTSLAKGRHRLYFWRRRLALRTWIRREGKRRVKVKD